MPKGAKKSEHNRLGVNKKKLEKISSFHQLKVSLLILAWVKYTAVIRILMAVDSSVMNGTHTHTNTPDQGNKHVPFDSRSHRDSLISVWCIHI